jgi:hypothetical protein
MKELKEEFENDYGLSPSQASRLAYDVDVSTRTTKVPKQKEHAKRH